MADGLALAKLVEMGLDVVLRNAEVLVEEAEEIGIAGGLGVVLEGKEFDAIAGGEDEAFADAGLVDEGTGGVGETAYGNGEALTHLDGCGVVVDAEKDESSVGSVAHGAVNLWTAES
jgi:hypothetical protein